MHSAKSCHYVAKKFVVDRVFVDIEELKRLSDVNLFIEHAFFLNVAEIITPGSGKSMSCKSEIVSVFLTTADDIFISDPEAEYYPLVLSLIHIYQPGIGGRRSSRPGRPPQLQAAGH